MRDANVWFYTHIPKWNNWNMTLWYLLAVYKVHHCSWPYHTWRWISKGRLPSATSNSPGCLSWAVRLQSTDYQSRRMWWFECLSSFGDIPTGVLFSLFCFLQVHDGGRLECPLRYPWCFARVRKCETGTLLFKIHGHSSPCLIKESGYYPFL